MVKRRLLVVIESPFAGNVERNTRYARACMRDSLKRGEFPYASHLLYTQPGILNDRDPEERRLGMEAGFAWEQCADLTAIYTNYGISKGMEEGILEADSQGRRTEFRRLDDDWDKEK